MDDRALNILLVDDDEVDVLAVERAFAKAKLTNPIHVASTAAAALAMLRGERVPPGRRLILLDLDLPRMTGLELLRTIRKDPTLRSTTVVVLTTSPEDRVRVDALGLDVAAYLHKPVTFQAFAEVMAALNKCWTLCELP